MSRINNSLQCLEYIWTEKSEKNLENLRDLIAATGLVILFTLDSTFSACMTFKLYGWIQIQWGASSMQHQALSIISKPSLDLNWSYSPETFNLGEIGIFCQMTLENNRAPLLCHFKICASFRSHQSIQTGVVIRKCPIRINFGNLRSEWPRNLMDDLEKQ